MVGESLPIVEVGVITVTAILFGVAASRLKLSAALGFVLAGVALGPLALRFLVPNQGLAPLFGDIGIFLLMFYLGLELNVRKFSETGGASAVLAILQMAFTFAAGFIVSRLLGFGELEGIVIGAMLVASSTAIISKLLIDTKQLESLEGRITLSILIFQDFFAIFILVLLTSLSSQRSFNIVVLNALFFMVGMFFVINRVSRYVMNLLDGMGHANKIAFYAIGIGVLTEYFGVFLGLSASLGAYFAGLALAETAYGERIKREIGFYREFFILFFFVSFGATIFYNPITHAAAIPPLAELMPIAVAAGVLAIAYFASSMLAIGIGSSFLGLSRKTAAGIGVLFTVLGEFLIIIASASQPLLPPDDFIRISTLAFLLILFTGPFPSFFSGNRGRLEGIYATILGPVSKILSKAGRHAMHVEANLMSKAQHAPASRILQNIAKNLVIALAVVYLALYAESIPASRLDVGGIPLYGIMLLFIVYPLFRTMIELRSLFEAASLAAVSKALHQRRGKAKFLEEEVASALTGVLLVAIGLAASAIVYYALPQMRVYVLVPGAYTVIAMMQLSRSIYNIVEHYDAVAGMDGAGPSVADDGELSVLSQDFDERSTQFRELHSARENTRERIREAMRAGDAKLVRSLLVQLKRKEETLLHDILRKKTHESRVLKRIVGNRDTRTAFEEYLLKKTSQPNYEK